MNRYTPSSSVTGSLISTALWNRVLQAPATLRAMERLWSEHSADAFLTTSKDQVKLLGRTELPIAELPIAACPEEDFWSWLDGRIEEMLTE